MMTSLKSLMADSTVHIAWRGGTMTTKDFPSVLNKLSSSTAVRTTAAANFIQSSFTDVGAREEKIVERKKSTISSSRS